MKLCCLKRFWTSFFFFRFVVKVLLIFSSTSCREFGTKSLAKDHKGVSVKVAKICA